MIHRSRAAAARLREQRGFSLIELLIVMVIIAILVLIAIPAISSYRNNARIAAVQSDLRNAATQLESSFLTTGVYPAVGEVAERGDADSFMNVSDGVTLTVEASDGDSVCIEGSHASVNGGGVLFYYSSADADPVQRGVHAGNCEDGTTTAPTGGGTTPPTTGAPAPTTAPSAPASPTSPPVASDNTVTVSWTAVTGATGYELQYRSGSGAWTTVTPAPTSNFASVTVPAYGSYEFQVRATNANGASAWTSLGTVTTIAPAPTAAPTDFSYTASGRAVTVDWSDIPNASSYEVTYTAEYFTYEGGPHTVTVPSQTVSPSPTASSVTITAPYEDAYLDIRVTAVNAAGRGPAGSFTASSQPSQPVDVTATYYGDGYAPIEWVSPQGNVHEIRYRAAGAAEWTSAADYGGSTSVFDLQKNTTYEIQVRAVGTYGAFSDWVGITLVTDNT